MTVNLRDRVFSDTGGVVQGATVQAILVTGGGTDAGTGSVVQATTTSDVNGVWKFAALPDPGAGNWYDTKITNGNQIRWRYGNIQSALNSILTSNTSFQMPALGIGTAPPASGLQVQTGNVGIGLAPSATTLLAVAGSVTGSTTYGAFIEPTLGNASSSANAVSILPSTANSFTTPFMAALRIQGVSFGTAQSITNFYQEFMDSTAVPAGVTNAYGHYVNAPTGASGVNLAAQLVGGGVVIGSIANAAPNYPPNGALALGTGGVTSLSGSIRMQNGSALAWRNAANTSDLTWAVSGSDNFECVNAGAVVGRFTGSPAAPQTTLALLCNDGTVTSIRQVVMGNADSGGAGFRLLRVVN